MADAGVAENTGNTGNNTDSWMGLAVNGVKT
jgi:hypothetical protein